MNKPGERPHQHVAAKAAEEEIVPRTLAVLAWGSGFGAGA